MSSSRLFPGSRRSQSLLEWAPISIIYMLYIGSQGGFFVLLSRSVIEGVNDSVAATLYYTAPRNPFFQSVLRQTVVETPVCTLMTINYGDSNSRFDIIRQSGLSTLTTTRIHLIHHTHPENVRQARLHVTPGHASGAIC